MFVGMLATWFPENQEEGINPFSYFLANRKIALPTAQWGARRVEILLHLRYVFEYKLIHSSLWEMRYNHMTVGKECIFQGL